MNTIRSLQAWRRALVGPALLGVLLGQAALVFTLIPANRPSCTSSVVFGCTSWTPFLILLGSLPLYYVGWALLLRNLGGWLPWLAPLAIGAGTWFVASTGLLPDQKVASALIYLLAAIGWEVLGARQERVSGPSGPRSQDG